MVRRARRIGLVLSFALMAFGVAVANEPAQPAPYTVTTQPAELAGSRVSVDVYRPLEAEGPENAESAEASAPPSVAIVAHGFSRDRTRGRDLGRDLARAGIVAIVPDLPNVVDYWSNGDALRAVVDQLERGAFGLPPTPRAQIVLIGTSAGAVAALIAASKLPGIAGWVGLDPVDRSGTAAYAAAKVTVPAVVLLGEPSVCNLFGSGKSIAQSVPTLLRAERVSGASHCDFEGPTNNFCRTMCGRSPRGRDEAVRRETVSATLALLNEAGEPRPGTASPLLPDDAAAQTQGDVIVAPQVPPQFPLPSDDRP